MGQLLTLMVLGDMVAANADNNHPQRQQPAQYRTAHDGDGEDDTDCDTDEGGSGAQYTGSTDPGLVTLRSSCSEGAGISTERRQEDNFDEDGAGQRGGEFRCDLSTLESWSCSVHSHRTGLDGNERPVAGSSGRGPGAGGEEEERFQLMRIMDIPDRTQDVT